VAGSAAPDESAARPEEEAAVGSHRAAVDRPVPPAAAAACTWSGGRVAPRPAPRTRERSGRRRPRRRMTGSTPRSARWEPPRQGRDDRAGSRAAGSARSRRGVRGHSALEQARGAAQRHRATAGSPREAEVGTACSEAGFPPRAAEDRMSARSVVRRWATPPHRAPSAGSGRRRGDRHRATPVRHRDQPAAGAAPLKASSARRGAADVAAGACRGRQVERGLDLLVTVATNGVHRRSGRHARRSRGVLQDRRRGTPWGALTSRVACIRC
jgi:hypothetical protein